MTLERTKCDWFKTEIIEDLSPKLSVRVRKHLWLNIFIDSLKNYFGNLPSKTVIRTPQRFIWQYLSCSVFTLSKLSLFQNHNSGLHLLIIAVLFTNCTDSIKSTLLLRHHERTINLYIHQCQ